MHLQWGQGKGQAGLGAGSMLLRQRPLIRFFSVVVHPVSVPFQVSSSIGTVGVRQEVGGRSHMV